MKMIMISVNDLIDIGCNKDNVKKHYDSIIETFNKYDINTPKRQAAFLANVIHETAMLKTFEENLNYSAKGLLSVFPKRVNKALAEKLEHKPEDIANHIYGGRYGNNSSGDGWRYRGRGGFQYTFKDNYNMISKALKIDFVKNPDLLKEPPYAILSAGFFWSSHKLNQLADNEDIRGITKVINGGMHGFDDRLKYYNKLLQLYENKH